MKKYISQIDKLAEAAIVDIKKAIDKAEGQKFDFYTDEEIEDFSFELELEFYGDDGYGDIVRVWKNDNKYYWSGFSKNNGFPDEGQIDQLFAYECCQLADYINSL